MRKLPFILAMFILPCMACKHDSFKPTSNITDVPDPTGPAITLSNFPLTIGNMWVYDNGDTMRAVSDSTINGVAVTRLVVSNSGHQASFYCANKADGFYIVASNMKYDFNYLTCPLSGILNVTDTLQVPAPSVLYAKYPIDTATQWNPHNPGWVNAQKQWMGYYVVTTPAGTFNCVALNSGGLIEYYSSKGLVKTKEIIECITGPCPPLTEKLIYVNF